MSVLLMKLLWTPKGTSRTQNITDIISLDVARGLEIKNNILRFPLKNTTQYIDSDGNLVNKHINSSFGIKFQEDDSLKLYLHYTDDASVIESAAWDRTTITEPSATYLKGTYFVIDFGFKQSINGEVLTVSAADKSYILFNRLHAQDYSQVETSGTTDGTSANKLIDSGAKFTQTANVGMRVVNTTDDTFARITNIDSDVSLTLSSNIMISGEDYQLQWTAPSILQKVIRFSSEDSNGLFAGTGSDAGTTYDVDARMETDEGGYIQDVRKATYTDGTVNLDTVFPGVSMTKIWKPVYEWAEELSQIEFLNSGEEIDELNNKKLVYGRKFMLWVDENNAVHWQEMNDSSSATLVVGTDKIYSYSLKESASEVINFVVFRGGEDLNGVGTLDYVVDTSVSAKLKKMHVIAMTDIAKQLIEKEIAIGNLVQNSAGSFTFSGQNYNRNGTVTPDWTSTSYSSDNTYNNALRDQIIKIGKNRARAVISGRNTTRLKGPVELKGAIYSPGDLITLTNKFTGQNEELIRITEVRDMVDSSGWFTTLQLEQDDETIISLA